MDWLARLNRAPSRIALGEGVAEILMWGYAEHISDNALHRHTFSEICQVGAYGRGLFISQSQEHPIQPGDIFIARPGVMHQIINSAHPEMELYWVSFRWIPPCQSEESDVITLMRNFDKSSVLISTDEDKRVAVLWNMLRTLASDRLMLGWEAQMSSLIAALLLAVAQVMAGSEAQLAFESRGPGPCETIVQSALRYISDNLDRPSLSVSEIAMHFGVSPRHLSRLFARFISMSPTDYIMRSRLDRSRSLLIHTDIPIKEVVALTGYSDVQYFTRLFTRRFECPPARYRRKMEPYVYNLSQVTPP